MTKIVPGQKTVCYMEQFLNSFISTLIKKQLKQDAYIYEFYLSQVTFQRQLQPEKDCHSFSLIYAHGERSLDLVIF